MSSTTTQQPPQKTPRVYTANELPTWLMSDVKGRIMFTQHLQEVCDKLPRPQVNEMFAIMKTFPNGFYKTEISVRVLMVHIRWNNKICCRCHKHDAGTTFIVCDKCELAFYCSSNCALQDFHDHVLSSECCNTNLEVSKIRMPFQFATVRLGPPLSSTPTSEKQ